MGSNPIGPTNKEHHYGVSPCSSHAANSPSDHPSSTANNHSSDDKSGTQSNAQSDHKPDHTDKDQSNGYAATNDINDAVTIHSYGATGEAGATYKDNVVQYVSRVNPDAQNLSDGAKQLDYKSTLTYMFNPYYGSQRVDLVSGSLTVYYADRCTKTPMHNSDAFDWKCPASAVVPAQDYTYEYHADSVDTSAQYPQPQLMYNVITMHLPNRVALLVCYSYQGFSTKENGHGAWGGLTTRVRLDGYPMAENYISMHFEGLDPVEAWSATEHACKTSRETTARYGRYGRHAVRMGRRGAADDRTCMHLAHTEVSAPTRRMNLL
ncbi:hypothetical protein [Bifidobacterium magnum]|uniref:hypothetical protein n=1 Tax=Bifidobacterium magnum TaxID=1692 RepID=UPI00047A0FD6|nr:hypothetical protein [Bifidobacterium magnum]